jgi:hypothetical protein
MAEAPFEIGGKARRILMILWIANFLLIIAVGLLGATLAPSLADADVLLIAIFAAFGLLTLGLLIGPAIAFLHYTFRPGASVSPRLRRSALIAAAAPLVPGVWAVTADEGMLVTLFGVALILLAIAVVVRLSRTPRAEPDANPPVVRTAGAIMALVVVALGSLATPHGPTRSQSYTTAMRSDLRNLHTVQQLHFDSTKRYSADLAALDFKPSTNVNGPFITLGPSGWTAANSHSKMHGLVCAIAVNMTNPVVPTAGNAEPACTDSVKRR